MLEGHARDASYAPVHGTSKCAENRKRKRITFNNFTMRTAAVVVASLLALSLCHGVHSQKAEAKVSMKPQTAKTLPPALADAQFKKQECDILAPGAICLFDGKKVLLPDAIQQGLLGTGLSTK